MALHKHFEGLRMRTTLKAFLTMTAWVVAPLAFAGSMDGTWIVNIDAPTGQSKATLVLTQSGDAITGSYTGQFGEAPVTGTASGNDVTITYHVEMQGVPLEVRYVGKVQGHSFNGKVNVIGFGEGSFKATKQS